MINSIQDRRVRCEDGYKLYLEIPEKEYLTLYNERINQENAKDVLHQYLERYEDDAQIQDVKIKHDKNNHSINIQANLMYEGNEHTDLRNIPHYFRNHIK